MNFEHKPLKKNGGKINMNFGKVHDKYLDDM